MGRRREKEDARSAGRAGRICSITGMILIVLVIILCSFLALPGIFSYQMFNVISGSMEPAIPVGSLVYVRPEAPETVEETEVIAFYASADSAAVITHRVTENRVTMGEFITKGDANRTEDMNPVPYTHFIGKVACGIPMAGKAAELLTSSDGKFLAGGAILGALLLQALAAFLGRRQD